MKSVDSILKRQIISTLYFEKSLSIVELSETLGKSVPHITKSVNELIAEGVLTEGGQARSSGGRRPQVYILTSQRMFIIAVAMDQLYTKVTITDTAGNTILAVESKELVLLNNDTAVQALVDLLNSAIARSGVDSQKIVGIGIGMPGFVNIKAGINYSYLVPENGETICAYLERELGIPVSIDNDSSVVALAELKFGLAKHKGEVMVVNVGWGIGLGMIVGGKIFRGFSGYAGELSHIPIADGEVLCECGKRGCLETEATLRVVTDKAKKDPRESTITGLKSESNPEKLSEAIMAAANKGDQFCVDLLSDMAYKLGKAIAILIHIVNPQLVLLSGRGSAVGRILLAPIQQALNRYCIPRLFEHTDVKYSLVGAKAELIGAGALVMENFAENSEMKIKKQIDAMHQSKIAQLNG